MKSDYGAWRTLVRGLRLTPEFRRGLTITLLLGLFATAGRLVVPVAVQQTLDRGVLAEGGPYLDIVVMAVGGALLVIAVSAAASYGMNARLARATETALAALRVRAFRHIHDLSLLHHTGEHRGALVARVTADIDEISRFMQWGGLILIVNVGQLLLATVAMLWYSWQLTIVVLVAFSPLLAVLRWFQHRLSDAYDAVRERVGRTLTVIGESVVGAPVIRAYGIEPRTNARIGEAVTLQYGARIKAARLSSVMFSSGEVFAAIATATAVIVGIRLGLAGQLAPAGEPWVGRLVAFMFLVTLFVGPVQIATEVLDQAQTAISGWRRVLRLLDTPADVADPDEGGQDIPPGPVTVRFEGVCFAYPAQPRPLRDQESGDGADGGSGPAPALRDIDVTIPARARVAVVGETGSGKTTFAKLLTRLMDPSAGRVLVNGVPLEQVRFSSLRHRIVMVPQDGFLFDTTVAENICHGQPSVSEEDLLRALDDLGLAEWVAALPRGIATPVGERGEFLSGGERQLVALARAYVADPDLLVLDEATSAVDPATEMRLQRALSGLTRGRTSVTVAHRLSTAEAADEVLVFDGGAIVQRGPHRELVDVPGVYSRLYESWRGGAVSA